MLFVDISLHYKHSNSPVDSELLIFFFFKDHVVVVEILSGHLFEQKLSENLISAMTYSLKIENCAYVVCQVVNK